MRVGALERVGPFGKIAWFSHKREHAASRCLDGNELHVKGLHGLVLLLQSRMGLDA
jgi:hypothetical protein